MDAQLPAPSSSAQLSVADRIAVLTLARPPVNALNQQLIADIGEFSRWLAQAGPQRVGALVLWGGPKLFAAGADIKEMAAMSYQEMAAASVRMQESFAALAGLPFPVIAAITGYALGGGCELALCADLRVCGEGAKLGQPEVLLGLIPGLGGTQRLPRLVGPGQGSDPHRADSARE
jgi:enoyl-CoA hydratase/carnithine racemase